MRSIQPVSNINVDLAVSGSKSITQQALVAAALAGGESLLLGALNSEDTNYLRSALRALGVHIDCSDPEAWRVQGCGGRLRAPDAPIYLQVL